MSRSPHPTRPGYLEFCEVSVFRCSIMLLAYLLEQQIIQDRKQSYAKKETSASREN